MRAIVAPHRRRRQSVEGRAVRIKW